jgi:hypothetical protein
MATSGKELLTLTVLRRRAGITQEELAAAIPGCYQPDISMWEAGAPIPTEKAQLILKLFKASKMRGHFEVEDLSKPWDEVLLRQNGVRQTGVAQVTS